MFNIEAVQLRFTKDIGELNKKRIDSISNAISHFYKAKEEDVNESLFFYDLADNEDETPSEDNVKGIENGLIITPRGLTFLLSFQSDVEKRRGYYDSFQ